MFTIGDFGGFLSTSQLLVRWVDAHGFRFDGHAREIMLHGSEDLGQRVAELQAPVAATGNGAPSPREDEAPDASGGSAGLS
jgi:hypothetical protein